MQQATLIGYGSAEVSDKIKLADDRGTISTSQRFTKQMQEQSFVACLSPLFHKKHILTLLNCVMGKKVPRLFSKLTSRFVAIYFSVYLKMKMTIFTSQKSPQI